MRKPPVLSLPPVEPLPAIVGWILDGLSESQIKAKIAEQWPRRHAGPLIVQAMTKLADASNADASLVMGFAIEGTRVIYQKAMQAGELAIALRALKQISELTGG